MPSSVITNVLSSYSSEDLDVLGSALAAAISIASSLSNAHFDHRQEEIWGKSTDKANRSVSSRNRLSNLHSLCTVITGIRRSISPNIYAPLSPAPPMTLRLSFSPSCIRPTPTVFVSWPVAAHDAPRAPNIRKMKRTDQRYKRTFLAFSSKWSCDGGNSSKSGSLTGIFFSSARASSFSS